MTARCHNDSCSIEWSEVTTLSGQAYEAAVSIDSFRGLMCTEDEGVGVNLVNDTAADAACRNILRRTALGELHASIPNAVIQSFSDDLRTAVNADRDTDAGDYATTPTHEYTNASGCDELVLVTGNLFYRYAILGEGSAVTSAGNLERVGNFSTSSDVFSAALVTPFNAMVNAVVQYGISVAPSLTADRQQFGVSGNMVTFSGSQEYQFGNERRKFFSPIVVPAGNSLRINSAWAYEGKDQTMNVIAYGSTAFANLGAYIKDGAFVALPMGG